MVHCVLAYVWCSVKKAGTLHVAVPNTTAAVVTSLASPDIAFLCSTVVVDITEFLLKAR